MKKSLTISLFIFAIAVSYNCKKELDVPAEVPSEIKLDLPSYDYSVRNTVYYEDNKLVDNKKATLGRVLFYDKALSLNNSVSCASCHQQENAFSDTKSFSTGFKGGLTKRNSMSIVNLKQEIKVGYFWDGRESKIEEMVLAPIKDHIEMGFENIEQIEEKLNRLPYYRKLFMESYGSEEVTIARMGESLGNFVFSIVSYQSKFDLFTNGSKPSSFNPSEIRGMDLFKSKKCGTCHLTSNFLTTAYYTSPFANIGLDENDADGGRNGQFKIPRLRNLTKTAPYMHDGRYKTLEEVLDHYSHNIKDNPNLNSILMEGGSPKQYNFSEQETTDLIAFLKTMDDNDVTTDIKFSSPFNK